MGRCSGVGLLGFWDIGVYWRKERDIQKGSKGHKELENNRIMQVKNTLLGIELRLLINMMPSSLYHCLSSYVKERNNWIAHCSGLCRAEPGKCLGISNPIP